MATCPVCRQGILEDKLTETWMQKGNRWVLFRNVPAVKCEVCGETTFSQKVAERLAAVLSADSPYVASRLVTCPEYDFAHLGKASPVFLPGTAELLGLPTFIQPKLPSSMVKELKTESRPMS